MALVTLADLKDALGVGGLYDDAQLQACATAAENLLIPMLKTRTGGYDTIPEVQQAGLQIAIELWTARTAPGGQTIGADWTPSPYRLGRTLLARVQGVLAQHWNTSAWIG